MAKNKNQESLFVTKIDSKIISQIHNISEKTGAAKWIVVNSLLSAALNIKTEGALDFSKFVKSDKK